MTLHQAYIPDSTINIIVWWRSDAFPIYLQVQVAPFMRVLPRQWEKSPGFAIKSPPPPAPPRIPSDNLPEKYPPTPHDHPDSTISDQAPSQFTNPGTIGYFPSPDPSTQPIRGPPDDSPGILCLTPQSHLHSKFPTKTTSTSPIRDPFVNFMGTLHLTHQAHNHFQFSTRSPSSAPSWVTFDISLLALSLGIIPSFSFFFGHLLLPRLGSFFEVNGI